MDARISWKLRALCSLLGGFLIHLTLGTVYTYGNMAPYIISYIRNNSRPHDLDASDAPWVLGCVSVGISMSMYFGGLIAQRYSVRLASSLGCAIMTSGVLLSYFTIQVSYVLFLVTYGLMVGVGVGLAYVGPLYCVIRWFPRWKGFTSGLVVCGFGGGALIFNYVQTGFLNSKNSEPMSIDHLSSETYFTEHSLLSRVPYLFLLLGGIYFVLQVIGCVLLFEPKRRSQTQRSETDPLVPPDSPSASESASQCSSHGYNHVPIDASYGASLQASMDSVYYLQQALVPSQNCQFQTFGGKLSKYQMVNNSFEQMLARAETLDASSGNRSSAATSTTATAAPSEERKLESVSLRPIELFKDVNFYILWFFFLFNSQVEIIFSSMFKLFGETYIQNDNYLTVVASTSAAFNAAGRIFWGVFADRFSTKVALVMVSAITTAAMGTLYLSHHFESHFMYFVWVCLIFWCIGGNYCLLPTATCYYFGPGRMAANYGVLFTANGVAGVAGALLSSLFSDTLGWGYGLLILAGISALGLVLSLVLRDKKLLRLSS